MSEAKPNSNTGSTRRRPRGRGKRNDSSSTSQSNSTGNNNDQPQRNGGDNHNSTTKNKNNKKSADTKLPYPPHLKLEACLERYHRHHTQQLQQEQHDICIVRGKLRVTGSRDSSSAYVTCDRGLHERDIFIPTPYELNRAMDGDQVFVELDPEEEEINDDDLGNAAFRAVDEWEEEAGDEILVHETATWQDDPVQMKLWNPIVAGIPLQKLRRPPVSQQQEISARSKSKQRTGRVVHIIPPKPLESELQITTMSSTAAAKPKSIIPNRRIVGSIQQLPSWTLLFNPMQRSLPQFKCPPSTTRKLLDRLLQEQQQGGDDDDGNNNDTSSSSNRNEMKSGDYSNLLNTILFQAEYVPLSWKENMKWPPCCQLQQLGDALTLEHELQALLITYNVDHGDFAPAVLQHVDQAVHSGLYYNNNTDNSNTEGGGEVGWKPTPEMYEGRRDYRNERIFTIDPTTAKDLDDALHIKLLESDGNGNGIVEVGVHIADVSFFVRPDTPVDLEAQRRTTTVYLIDRTIPMLPRPLCEIACSLNENVERLAFSCVWKMHLDGTLVPGPDQVWYGRTVIKSCARLDYSTAQNIIDGKVATGESDLDEILWPPHRRPTEPHTVDQVAADVRLMHKVAMARRRVRFENGALALNGTKLTFQLDTDGQTPLLVAPYPIRDSNRLVEEYMLLANFLVAQRLITHAGSLALLRMHPEPLMDGLDSVVNIANAAGIDIDISTSQTLHESLVNLAQQGDSLLLQCVTNLMMTPMQAAEYFVTGCTNNPEEWRHYALNIPYYTHFTSPIRRYPDVLVHRLLQATIDDKDALKQFPMKEEAMQEICQRSNDKRLNSKYAQERCDRIYLSLFVRKHPLVSQMAVVLSVGKSSFTVFIPSLGTSALLFLQEHQNFLTYATDEQKDGSRRILLQQKPGQGGVQWKTLEIKVLVKLTVTVVFKEKTPIDIKARLEGPWTE